MKTLKINVFGKVQGVYYRDTTKAVADQLGIKGIVKNLPDGSVYIEAQGEDYLLEELKTFCAEGSERAEVECVDVSEMDAPPYRNFDVIKK